jgi:hypothetical protein
MNSEWDPRRLVTGETPRRLATLLLLLYIGLTAFIAFHHEPWRDEADPWLYVRDLSLHDIIARTRYSGLPALWFLTLAPLAKAGLAYGSQKLLHLAVAAAAVALFLFRAPLSRLTKTLTIFSYFLLYEYSVIVRSYAMTVLLAFLAAHCHRSRNERTLTYAAVLFLLFNVNAQGFLIAASLAAVWGFEQLTARKLHGRNIAAAVIIAAGAVLTWLQVRTPPDPARHAARHLITPAAAPWAVGNAFAPTFPLVIGVIIGVAVLIAVAFSLQKWSRLFLLLAAGTLLSLYTFIYIGGLRHAGFILVSLLVALWIDEVDDGSRRRATAALLLNGALFLSLFAGATAAVRDLTTSFSGAEEMARFIQQHDLFRHEIAAHNLTQAEALLPYFPGKSFWYAGLGENGTFMKWDTKWEAALNVPYPEAEARARRHFAGKPWLLLFNVEIPNPSAHGFRLLYTNRELISEKSDETYWLYQPLDAPAR